MAGALHGLDEGDGADQEGRRSEVAADLLEDDARLDMAEAEAAFGFADQDPGEAHFGELLPQSMAEAVLAIAVAPVAQLLRDRAFLGDEAARRIAKHRLIVGEVEWHEVPLSSPQPRLGSMLS